jgi:hypothetical protein
LKGQNPVGFLSAPEAKFGQFCRIEAQPGRNVSSGLTASQTSNCKKRLEARVGIELLIVLKTKQIALESIALPDENLNIRRGLAQN